MDGVVIHCRQLTKSFKQYKKEPGLRGSLKAFVKRHYEVKQAVEGFDLTVNKGEMIGLLGPNGAGKTTLMKMFTGIIVPTSGEMRVLGHEPFQRDMSFRKKIALVMGQKSQLWWDIPAMDSFLLLQKYYEIPNQTFQDRLNELVTLLEVKPLLHVHVRKLSLGERMKMELMASLLHNPDVIFLDEPTIGLDLIAQQKIREFIINYQRQHETTVILTSHYMADVAALCSRIVLILGGQKRFDGSISTFENILGREKFVTMTFHEPVNSDDRVWQSLDPNWYPGFTKVDLRISEQKLRATAIDILKRFPVSDLSTEKLPIERVMNTLLKDPDLLRVE